MGYNNNYNDPRRGYYDSPRNGYGDRNYDRYDGRNSYPRERRPSGAKGVKATKIISIVLVLVLLVANVVSGVYASVMGGLQTYSQQEIEDSRLSGDELDKLNEELADEIVSQTEVVDNGLPKDYIVSTDEVSLILLIGSDSRFGLDGDARSDSMMIVAIDRTHKKIKIISMMRDLYAIIPGYKNNRLNKAYNYDSKYKNLDLKITRETIEQNLGIALEDYVIIDFTGFKEIVDIMGGITMTLNKEEAKYMCSDKKYGLFPRFSAGAGEYLLNGDEALNYCRMRNVSGGDFGRTERQRKALSQIASQLKTTSIKDIYSIATNCTKYVATNIPIEEINGYVMEALDILSYEIVQLRIPIEGSYVQSRVYSGQSGMAVLWPNYKWNAEQLRKFIFEDEMKYSDSKVVAQGVSVPYLPAGTQTKPDPDPNETTTTTTGDTTTTATTTTTAAPPPADESAVG